jgi:hypothetical protein
MGCCSSSPKIVSKEGIKYKDIKEKIKPLDLIVFRGSDFVSDSISMVQNLRLGQGEWTHVGLIITTDFIPIKNGVPGKLYVWESTMSGKVLGDGVNDLENNKGTFGVQIRDFEEVVDKYDNNSETKIGWCSLLNNPIATDPAKVKETLTRLHSEIGNATYDYNFCNLFSTMFCTCSTLRRSVFGHSNKYFCSELVTKIYIELGIISKNVDPEKVAPAELLGFTNDKDLICPVNVPAVVITRNWK